MIIYFSKYIYILSNTFSFQFYSASEYYVYTTLIIEMWIILIFLILLHFFLNRFNVFAFIIFEFIYSHLFPFSMFCFKIIYRLFSLYVFFEISFSFSFICFFLFLLFFSQYYYHYYLILWTDIYQVDGFRKVYRKIKTSKYLLKNLLLQTTNSAEEINIFLKMIKGKKYWFST